ncbi:o-succinylbenzoate synthase [Natronolimnobius baerhuensis]|uniref:o-succinylbenzoate synthase n=1 Tax=Natronolimnobius baerhuensis TaxID=253108 RepID=A0A202EDK0_9EURY|nr:o-succinylbenzoate synthase [Natronolimnobius baerhuensis]OVE86295.1 o-succinylbenzoate synthase [Natronolimnobius baerhuensis]
MNSDRDLDADRGADDTLEFDYQPFSLALEEPLETAAGPIDAREGFLVRLVDIDGTIGYGEATPLPGWTESEADCEAALERVQPALEEGGPSAALEAVDQQVAARHALSLALADLQATRQSTPLYRYLGNGPMIGRVPVNATIGDGSPAATSAAARRASDRGFSCCKLKVGLRSLEADLERIRETRAAVGEEMALRVDANEAWSYDEAERALETLADLDVAVLEQPLPAGALEGHADLRAQQSGVDIALDEGLLEHGVDNICEVGAADAVVLKPMALGGIDVARKLAAWVTELGITPIITTTIDGVVARTGAVHLAAAIPDIPPCGLATAELLAEDLGRDPVLLEKGAAVVPQAKGLGVDGVWADE